MEDLHITIHPFSALIGAALVCLTMLTVGAIAVQGSSSTRDVSAIEIVSDPHPREFVRIVEGAPYTVPSGKILVPTAFGSNTWALNGSAPRALYKITADGIEVWKEMKIGQTLSNVWAFAPNEMTAVIPTGLAFVEQTLVSVIEEWGSPTSTAILLGYLVDA
jgi:hypothetical protein